MTGRSPDWGSPVNAYSGGQDAYVACLDSTGNLLWNTFLGSSDNDEGGGIILDSSGNIHVTGESSSTWGSPINAHSGGDDVFIACLDSSGNLLWNSFLGSSSEDSGNSIALDNSGNIYLIGESNATWGSPVSTHSGDIDTFVACLDSSCNLLWNTFLGSGNEDCGKGISLDISGNIYVIGQSDATWGSPINAYSGSEDVYIASLNNTGTLMWNTFLGNAGYDWVGGIRVDTSGNIYASGTSSSWGSPVNPHSGGWDAFLACLNTSGNLLWNTFLGSLSTDLGGGIVLDNSGNIYMVGQSNATWGLPINAHSGGSDIFVSKINPHELEFSLDIKANGSDGPISITQADTLQIKVSLNSNGSTANVDFWLAYKGPSGWVHYNNTTKKWEAGLGVTHQGPLMDLNNKKVFQKSGLAPGSYTFYFGVDMNMDGNLTKSELYYDQVKVTVTQ